MTINPFNESQENFGRLIKQGNKIKDSGRKNIYSTNFAKYLSF